MKFLRIEQLIFEYSKGIFNQIIFNVILIAQSDKMLDKQIRSLIEYDVKHIKMNNGFSSSCLRLFWPLKSGTGSA